MSEGLAQNSQFLWARFQNTWNTQIPSAHLKFLKKLNGNIVFETILYSVGKFQQLNIATCNVFLSVSSVEQD
jgi:hypothetical protein